MAKLTDSELMELLRLYEGQRCLWDTNSTYYKYRDERIKAMTEIAKKLNVPDYTYVDVKNKITNIRIQYMQELRKIEEFRDSDQPEYKPTYPWFEAVDKFLRPFMLERMRQDSEPKFTDDRMMEFIRLFKERPCLWNLNHPGRSREKRNEALAEIVKELDIPNFNVDDLKLKIKNVRSHYCYEVKRIQWSIKKGDKKIYKPLVPWFDSLDQFLRPHIRPQTKPDDKKTTVKTGQVLEPPLLVPLEQRNPPPNKKKRCHGDGTKLSTALRIIDIISAIAPTPSKETEFDIFGESIAAQLNNMPFEDALELQIEIQELISEKKRKLLVEEIDPLEEEFVLKFEVDDSN